MALSNLTKVQTVGIGSNIEVVGVVTTGQFKSGTSNLHSTGVELTNLNVSGIATIGSDLYLTGALVDTSGDTGSSGQLLASTGSGTNWINANSTSVLNAVNVGVNLNSTNANQFVSFFGASSGNNPNRVDVALLTIHQQIRCQVSITLVHLYF